MKRTLETFMFLEDINNQVLPHRLDRSPTVSVQISPARRRLRHVAAEIFEHDSWDPNEAAAEFVRRCAISLVEHEVVPYEIERLRRPRSNKISKVTLRPIQPWSVTPARGGLLQLVPEADRKIRGYWRDTVPDAILLPDANLLCFRLPTHLRKELSTALEALQAIPDSSLPTWLPEELAKSNSDRATVDVEELRTRRVAAIGAATRSLGWDARRSLHGVVSDYYLLMRQIRWQKFLCRLRCAVTETLNASLPSLLEPLQMTATITVNGLPDVGELQRLHDRLIDGTITLGEALSSMSVWRFGRDVYRNVAYAGPESDSPGE